jgi:hypothetical protein
VVTWFRTSRCGKLAEVGVVEARTLRRVLQLRLRTSRARKFRDESNGRYREARTLVRDQLGSKLD